ncbi:MAG: 23S rRNA (guanosine(2251)-2'-O)-methyltransferase RlmB [Clostridiales bacterium]|nr:23S rRNA (guanosine(2251)-2'-O)-methyltransferase RlmB [Clostridiales bacterium]MCD7828328.1 23S rRNA (guanosine(2251)-2'-O)-methyltransferase RlmB [Clostridiales bacterium]
MDNNNMGGKQNTGEDLIIGRNAVREALKADRPAECLFIQRGEHKGALTPIAAQCIEKKIPVKEVDAKKLDFMCGHGNHQGVILRAAPKEYSSVDDIFKNAEEKGEAPFIIICDGLEDPHNLGAVIRSAEAAGAHGVIIPSRRSAGLNMTVEKTSAGALEYMPVARVSNINLCMEELKKRGVWIYAADMDGTPYYETDMSGSAAIVIGSEGSGVSRLVKQNADFTVSIPMCGHINSLNASVAAGILMFEISKRRRSE